MKRDMNLIRDILLAVERNPSPTEMMQELEVPGFNDDDVHYHVELLAKSGMLTAHERQAIGLYAWHPIALTWEGHDFLDAVRDPDVWAKTQKGAEAAKGFTVDLLKDLAKGLIKKQIEEYTDVKL